ncbi:peptide antibiotic transporter SbmA [Cryptosporidium felis]|nr:peptide antibiotic transporter SbmA [Cryptosporidium felis]
MVLLVGLKGPSRTRFVFFLSSIGAIAVAVNYFEYSGSMQFKVFGDTLQYAVKDDSGVGIPELYRAFLGLVAYRLLVILLKSTSRYISKKSIFFWRIQLTGHFLRNWDKIYLVEGASQRIQEDTMRFCKVFEKLFIFLIQDMLKLIVYLPLLLSLSKYITKTWLIPNTGNLLLALIVANSIIGACLIIFPSKYLTKRVYNIDSEEASFRKDLVLSELEEHAFDFPERYRGVDAAHRSYYNRFFAIKVVQLIYCRLSMITYWLFAHPSMAPPYSLGLLKQTMHAFDEVSTVFNFAVLHFKSLVEAIAVYQRLRGVAMKIEAEEPGPVNG